MKYLKKNVDISNLSNFKTSATAKYFYDFRSIDQLSDLKKVLDFANKRDLNKVILWAWTNTLFAFDVFNWIIIKNNLNWWRYLKERKVLETSSNVLISDIAEKLEYEFWQDIWHRFIWLPWTVAWAVYSNAWCFGLEVEHNFKKLEAFNMETWKLETFLKKDCEFAYRSSIFKKTWKYLITKVIFDLSQKHEKYSSNVDNIYFREHKQPKWNTCWSTFKNPSSENPAWKLIESVWLKWYNLNWAFFSPLHANFLISTEGAKHTDLTFLIDLAKKKVKDSFDIDLEPEIRIIKNI